MNSPLRLRIEVREVEIVWMKEEIFLLLGRMVDLETPRSFNPAFRRLLGEAERVDG